MIAVYSLKRDWTVYQSKPFNFLFSQLTRYHSTKAAALRAASQERKS